MYVVTVEGKAVYSEEHGFSNIVRIHWYIQYTKELNLFSKLQFASAND